MQIDPIPCTHVNEYNGLAVPYVGPSERGWHHAESALTCPRQYALSQSDNYVFDLKEPLVRGSLYHVGVATFLARQQALDFPGDVPGLEHWHSPNTAIELHARACQVEADAKGQGGARWEDFIGPCQEMTRTYANFWSAARAGWRVIGVEVPFRAQIAGHLYTQDLDLAALSPGRAGLVYAVDHKTTANPRKDWKANAGFSIGGQLAGYRQFGSRMWGDRFGGLRIDFAVFHKEHGRIRSWVPDAAPGPSADLVDTVLEAERRIADWHERFADREPHEYPGVFAGNGACVHRYGRCFAYECCIRNDWT